MVRTRAARLTLSTAHQVVQTPYSGPAAGDEKKHETIQHCELSSVQDRPKASAGVSLKIAYSHLAAGQERNGKRQEPEGNQASRAEFDDSRNESQRVVDRHFAAKRPEQLLRAVACKHKARHDAHQCVGMTRKLAQEVCHRFKVLEDGS